VTVIEVAPPAPRAVHSRVSWGYCRECKRYKVFKDPVTGELVCRNCGVVHGQEFSDEVDDGQIYGRSPQNLVSFGNGLGTCDPKAQLAELKRYGLVPHLTSRWIDPEVDPLLRDIKAIAANLSMEAGLTRRVNNEIIALSMKRAKQQRMQWLRQIVNSVWRETGIYLQRHEA